MKRAAVVGAGFAGLAAAYFLSERFKVTLLDQKGIGAGASGISSGLLHPYPGEKGRRSWYADEALSLAKKLIHESQKKIHEPVSQENGILRVGPILSPAEDVICLGPEQFLITSGITVFPTLYLKGLWLLCQERGVELQCKRVQATDELQSFDVIILAVGAGIRLFKERESLKMNFVKGQVLTCALDTPLERSISSKTYTAITPLPFQCHIGATYEREFHDDTPSPDIAVQLLKPRYPVLECRAGIRVTNPAHYFPILQQIDSRTWVITALGSRGLLYHAFLGWQLSKQLLRLKDGKFDF